MKRVLMVTLHFPPWSISTGHLRVLSFCRHLPNHGWEPVVLTAHPRAYAANAQPMQDVSLNGLRVYKAFALDTQEHLSIAGKYPSWLALPDRWSAWWLGGVWTGLRLIRRLRPDVLFSTYPVATAHLIGLTLSRITKLPWVADFRDPIVDGRFSADTVERRVRRWVERRTIENCTRALFTTDGARRDYVKRYPGVLEDRMATVPNGYDEESFDEAERARGPALKKSKRPLHLVHSGTLYPDLRDPRPLFRALRELKRETRLDAKKLQIIFRASGNETYYQEIAAAEQVDDIVSFEPGICHQDAVREMLMTDGLLLLQAGSANYQIPAKLYEYFRAGQPILALVDRDGDTARLLRRAGVESMAQYDQISDIKNAIEGFLIALENRTWLPPKTEFVMGCSRASRAADLASILDSTI